MKILHVIQHTSAEYLGLIEDHLEGRGIRFKYCRPFAGKTPLPHRDAVKDGVVLLGGGPWGAGGARDVPTLEQEIDIARACLMREWPVIGIGLGAQILAIAAGGSAQPAPLSFDVTTAHRTRSDALNGYLPEQYPVATYMRDWPVPPAYASVLAEDDAGRPVLWQIGRSALGFAGHPGLKLAMAEDLVMEFEEAPPDAAQKLQQLRVVQREMEEALVPMMTGIVHLTEWMQA